MSVTLSDQVNELLITCIALVESIHTHERVGARHKKMPNVAVPLLPRIWPNQLINGAHRQS